MQGYIWDIGDGRICMWGTHNEQAIRNAVAQYVEGLVSDEGIANIIDGSSKMDIMKGYRLAEEEIDIPHNISHWDVAQYRTPAEDRVPIALVFCKEYLDQHGWYTDAHWPDNAG